LTKISDIYYSLRCYADNHEYKLKNKYIFDWESDFFSVTKSNYSYEYEIKTSRNDFFADFKKEIKHAILEADESKNSYIVKEKSLFNSTPYSPKLVEYYKRVNYNREPTYPQTHIDIINISNKPRPNKFFYCCPEGLIKKEEVPKYAGLIYIKNKNYRIVKNAPFIHKNKFVPKDMLFDKYYYLYLETEKKLEQAKLKIKNLERRNTYEL
jgi:hypothetical protein